MASFLAIFKLGLFEVSLSGMIITFTNIRARTNLEKQIMSIGTANVSALHADQTIN